MRTSSASPWNGCAITIATRRRRRRLPAHAAAAEPSSNRCGRLAVLGGRTDLRRHGASDGAGRRWPARGVLCGGVADRRHGADVPADERLPPGAVAQVLFFRLEAGGPANHDALLMTKNLHLRWINKFLT